MLGRPALHREGRDGVEGRRRQMARAKFEITLCTDHRGVIAGQLQRRHTEPQAPAGGPFSQFPAQPGVGRDSPRHRKNPGAGLFRSGKEPGAERLADGALKTRAEGGKVRLLALLGGIVQQIDHRGFDAGKTHIERRALDVRLREGITPVVPAAGKPVKGDAAGIAESHRARRLVESFPRRVVNSGPKAFKITDAFDNQNLAMASGDQKQQIWIADVAGQACGQSMTFQVVDCDKRLIECQAHSLGGHDADDDTADEAGTGCGGDGIDILRFQSGVFESMFNYLVNMFEMRAGGNFRHELFADYKANRGETPELRENKGDFFFLQRPSGERLAATVAELCSERLPRGMGIPSGDIQVLTPTRKGESGTFALNERLQQVLNPPAPGKKEKIFGETVFREGDRVMQIRNNYDIVWCKGGDTAAIIAGEMAPGSAPETGTGIFNGDLGTILRIDTENELIWIDFDEKLAWYGFEQLGELDHAFAVTVHKAQGSEYRAVILSLCGGPQMLLTRSVLYTAITRARELLIIVGNEETVAAMTRNDRRQRRYSGLKLRLEGKA